MNGIKQAMARKWQGRQWKLKEYILISGATAHYGPEPTNQILASRPLVRRQVYYLTTIDFHIKAFIIIIIILRTKLIRIEN